MIGITNRETIRKTKSPKGHDLTGSIRHLLLIRLSLGLSLPFLGALFGCLPIVEVDLKQSNFYNKTRSAIIQGRLNTPVSSWPFLTGAAKVKIPTPPGLPMAGYGRRRSRGATGTHDPIYARALAIKQGEGLVVLVATDLLAITDEIKDAVLKKIKLSIPLTNETFLLAATHTHSGPGALASDFLEQFGSGRYDRLYFKKVTKEIALAVRLAYERLKPASVRFGIAQAPDLIINRMVKGGPIDPEIPFLLFAEEGGNTTASLVNFSAHATVLKSDNFLYSGDYPGFFEMSLETHGRVALFTAGAVADQTAQAPGGKDHFKQAELMGGELAKKVLDAEGTATIQTNPLLSVRTVPFILPPPQVKIRSNRRLPHFLSQPFFDRTSSLQMIRIGRVILIGIPGDLSVALGMKIKWNARQKGFEAIIIGLANDYIGYILPRELYFTSTYEASMSFHGPQMGEYLLEMITLLMEDLPDISAEGGR
ncbi:MAG: neutral/alkaline non-lysosomal ceramidase N-terminal domain-containing protein [Nitrospiria bacterium]